MDEVQKKRSPWLYVGLGCLGTLMFACIGTLIVGKLACNSVQQSIEDLKDQSKQEQKATEAANETLGGIPAGYYPVFSFGVPFLLDWILFVDQKPAGPDAGPSTFERVFYFMRIIETDQSKALKDYFDGTGDAHALRQAGMQVEVKEELGRGTLKVKDRSMQWIAVRGKIQMQGPYDSGQDAIVGLMMFDCPKDGKLRTAMWQMKDDGQTDLKGTVADPLEISKLLAPLSPCGK